MLVLFLFVCVMVLGLFAFVEFGSLLCFGFVASR